MTNTQLPGRRIMTHEEMIQIRDKHCELRKIFAQFASDRPRLEILNDIIEYAYQWSCEFEGHPFERADVDLYRLFIIDDIWKEQYEVDASYDLLLSFFTQIVAGNSIAFREAIEGAITGLLDTAVMLEHEERKSQ